MTSLQFSRDLPLMSARVVFIPKVKLKVINTNPHYKKEKGLVPVLIPHGEIMWLIPILSKVSNGLLWLKRSPKAKLERLIAMWWVFLWEKLRRVLPLSLTLKKQNMLSWWLRCSSHVKNSVRQTVFKIVWWGSGKFIQVSQGGNWTTHEATLGEAKSASLY